MIRKTSRRVVTRLAGTQPVAPRSTASSTAMNAAAGCDSERCSDATAVAQRLSPELIVGYGFRGWISGYQSGDIGCWEEVWRLYAGALGAPHARAAVGCLSEWAKSVAVASRHPIEVQPLGARGFCRDESLAISMIAAFQHNTCPAMRACAFALMETSLVDEVLHHAGTFALTLRSIDAVVPPAWIVNANAFVEPPGVHAH